MLREWPGDGVWWLVFTIHYSLSPNHSSEASAGQGQCGQATKGMWGMSRRQQAMKGVEDCDKLGGLVKRELIPGFPNHCIVNP